MSACAGFSTCRIQFIPHDQQRAERNYSDRSTIELRHHDFANFTLRVLDIDNNKAIIFDIPFEKEDQYKRGKSGTYPDEIRNSAGTYRLWLNAASRIKFHEALNLAIQEIKLLGPESPETSTPSLDPMTKTNPRHDDEQPKPKTRQDYEETKTNPRYDDEQPKPKIRQDYEEKKTNPRYDDQQPKPKIRQDYEEKKTNPRYDDEQPKQNPRQDYAQPKPAKQSNRNDILADVYQLGQHIRQGNIDEAVDLARKLSETRVRLQANVRKQHNDEKPIQIRVKLDSNDNKISRRYANDLTMGVYPSTTIRELRTAFEYSEDFPPSNQYFFVNGHLAHENSTINELDVRPDSLFVLFVIQQ